MLLSKLPVFCTVLAAVALAACGLEPVVQTGKKEPEILTVKESGDMVYRERKMIKRDVIIYEDGRGGERAAVRVFNPLHADYFRDSIIVKREENEETSTPNTE